MSKKSRLNNRLPDAEHQKRLRLYYQGLTDRAIATKVGISTSGVSSWRGRHGLPGYPRSRRPKGTGGVPMESILTPDECRIMKMFFGHLRAFAARGARGDKPNVGQFMNEWRKVYTEGRIPGAVM